MTAHSATFPPERLHALDAVRGLALMLGVALHATMSYLPGAQYFWITSDADPSLALGGLFYVVHLFRMTVFFLIAGYFGRMALQRLGAVAFARDRFKRIVVPLLSAWTPIFIAIVAVIVWAAWIKNGGSLPKEHAPGPAFTPADFPLTHLWFLYVLTLFYVGALAIRGLVSKLDGQGHFTGLIDTVVRGVMGPWAPLLLALPVATCLYLIPKWTLWFGVPTPDHSLYPNLSATVAYGVAFGLGWLLQRQEHLLARIKRFRWINVGLAITATVGCLSIVGLTPGMTPAADVGEKLVYALGYGIASWGWTFALLGLALHFLSGYNATRRYLADASYWVYIVHLPIVMALQVITAGLGWPWWIEYPMLLAVGFAIMLGSYQLMVRHSFIGAFLNGRRVPRPARTERVTHELA